MQCHLLGNQFGGLVIGDILDVAEDIAEGRDDEVVVVGEGTLGDVVTDATSVAEDDAGCVFALGANDNLGDSGDDDAWEQVLGAVKGSAVHAPGVRGAAVDLAEAELLADIGDLAGHAAAGVVVIAGGLLVGVVDEGVAVPVEVAAGVDKRRLRAVLGGAGRVGDAVGVLDTLVAAVGAVEAGHGDPAEGLAVAAGLDADGAVVVDGEVADVAVAAEHGDGLCGVDLADGVPDGLEGATLVLGADGVVAEEDKHVDGLLGVEGVGEPLLLDHVGGFDDLGGIGVACAAVLEFIQSFQAGAIHTGEVKENTKGHDADALVGGEVAILGADELELVGLGVLDLDVGSDIAVTPLLGIDVEHLIGNLSNVQLVVADRQKIVRDLVEDGHGELAILLGSVGETGTVVQITGINQKEVGAHVASSLLHATSKGNKVTPISAVVLLLEVALEPAVGVGLMIVSIAAPLDGATTGAMHHTVCKKLIWPHSRGPLGP